MTGPTAVPEPDAPHVRPCCGWRRRCSATRCCSACPSGSPRWSSGGVLRGTPGLVGAVIGVVLGLAAGLITTLVMRGRPARRPPAS